MKPAETRPAPPPRRLLPPLATALIGLIFAALFCVSALIDLRQLEMLLLSALQQRALTMVTALEKAVQENIHRLQPGHEASRFSQTFIYPSNDEDMALREALAQALLEVASRLDLLAQEGQPDPTDLAAMAQAEQLRGVQLVAADGRVVVQTGEGLAEREAILAPLLSGREEVVFQLFEDPQFTPPHYFLALRRTYGSGAVVLVLDQAGLVFWQQRIAVQTALENFPWSGDLIYFILTTPEDRLLGQVGRLPDMQLEPCQLLKTPADGRGQRTSLCTLAGEKRALELIVPFHVAQTRLGTARLGLLTQETDALLQESRRHIFLWTGVMLIIGMAAMAVIYRLQDRYLRRLQAMRERLQQAERLSSLGKLAAGVAHEIRNPLNAIGIAVQRLRREFLPEGEGRQQVFADLTKVIREEISRLNTIVEEFLSLSRGGRLDLQPVAPAALLHNVQALFQAQAHSRGVQLVVEVADACPPVAADLPKMQQVLVNLVKNALEAITGPGQILLRAAAAGADHVRLTVTDTGKGLAPEELDHIFDPYYTTKERGLGLGLALAHEIVQAHGGQMSVDSRPGAGTTFTIILPRQG